MTVETIDRALDALFALDPGVDRESWVRIAMAAKAAGLGADDFDRWSSGAANYSGQRDTLAVWRSFTAAGGIGPATLFGLAHAAGWRDPQREHQQNAKDRPQRPRQASDKASPRSSTSGPPGVILSLPRRRIRTSSASWAFPVGCGFTTGRCGSRVSRSMARCWCLRSMPTASCNPGRRSRPAMARS